MSVWSSGDDNEGRDEDKPTTDSWYNFLHSVDKWLGFKLIGKIWDLPKFSLAQKSTEILTDNWFSSTRPSENDYS